MKYSLRFNDIQRFWEKVEFRPDGCWQWTGGMTSSREPVPQFCLFGHRKVTARRVAYRIVLGRVPKQLWSLCDNPKCVCPLHMGPTPPPHKMIRTFGTRDAAKWKRIDEKLVRKVLTLRRLKHTQCEIAGQLGVDRMRVGLILRLARMCKEGTLVKQKAVLA